MTKSRTNADNVTADIAGITAGTGITGGGTSGTVTITNDMATTIAAAGDLIYGTANDAYAALSLGTAGKVLKVNSGATAPEWAVDPTTDVVTTAGDLIYGTGADAVARLGIGTAGKVLTVNSGATAPEWVTPAAGGFDWSLVNSPSGTALTGASSITVSGITGANKLMVIIDRASFAAGNRDVEFRINNDTGSNYFTPGVAMTPASAPALAMLGAGATNRISLGAVSSNSSSQFSGYVMITGGDTANNKMFEAVGACNQDGSGGTTRILGGRWSNSATISSIVLTTDAASNFDNGTIWVYKS